MTRVDSNGSSKPACYQSHIMLFYYFVGYDPSGSKKLIDVTPAAQKCGVAGGVQYDGGAYMTVGNQKRGLFTKSPTGKS
jgi:hypothetical protein